MERHELVKNARYETCIFTIEVSCKKIHAQSREEKTEIHCEVNGQDMRICQKIDDADDIET